MPLKKCNPIFQKSWITSYDLIASFEYDDIVARVAYFETKQIKGK
jgi:hypothetical protein